MTKHLAIIGLVFGLALPAVAGTGLFTDIHHQYEGIRAQGMGGAFVAVAEGSSVMFYNPAALARVEEPLVEMSLIDANGSLDLPNFYSQIQSLQGSGTTAITKDVQVLKGLYGTLESTRLKLAEVEWIRPNWGVALVPADLTVELAVNNAAVPAVDVRAYGDTTLAWSYGHAIPNDNWGRLSWGTTIKGIQREYVSTEMNVLDLATSSNSISSALSSGNVSDGFTVDMDFGFLFTPYLPQYLPDWFLATRPTFAFVGRNLLDYGFTTQFFKISSTATGAPEQLYRVFDLGSKFELPPMGIFGGRFAFDVRDMGHPEFNANRALHAGFEFDWTMASWWRGQWRAGYGQGNWSAGFSALFTVFRLDLATYADDVGSYNNPSPNRLVALRMSMDL